MNVKLTKGGHMLTPAAARAAAQSAHALKWATENQRNDAACKAARTYTGGRLSASQKQEIADIVARIAQRDSNRPATAEQIQPFPGTLVSRLDARVSAAVKTAASSCGYRRSESGWVGGGHYTAVRIGIGVAASGKSERVWHHRRSWSGTNSEHAFTVRRDWISRVQRAGLAVVDDMLTLDAHRVDDGIWQAVWAEQGRGFDLRAERGFLVRNRDGNLQHAPSEAAARRLQAAATPTPTPRATARARKVKAIAARAMELLRLPTDHWPASAMRTVVTASDSIAAGNCAAGTRDWMARHLSSIQTGLYVEEALLVSDRADFVRRACAWAIARAEAHKPAARKAA